MSEHTDLNDIPVENLEVHKQVVPVTPTVGSKEFCDLLCKEFSGNKVWRSTKSLSEKLNVDVVELEKFLDTQSTLCCRRSKEEGVFLYALLSRVNKEEKKAPARLLVSEDDRYALASLHNSLMLLESSLEKYALKVHERNPEAFNNLMEAKNKLEAGIVLYGQKIKAEMSKLPKV